MCRPGTWGYGLLVSSRIGSDDLRSLFNLNYSKSLLNFARNWQRLVSLQNLKKPSTGFHVILESKRINSLSCSQTTVLSRTMIATILQNPVRQKSILKSLLLQPHPGLEKQLWLFNFESEYQEQFWGFVCIYYAQKLVDGYDVLIYCSKVVPVLFYHVTDKLLLNLCRLTI